MLVTFKSLINGSRDLWGSGKENNSLKQLKTILRRAASRNRDRIQRIEKICSKYNLGLFKNSSATLVFKYPPTPQYSVFYFDQHHHIAYCPTYKAGSTTWLHNLLSLNGVHEEKIKNKQISEVARQYFPELDAENAIIKIRHSKKLFCIRHPFERILSAYRDKLEDRKRAPEHGTMHYYKRWGSRIRNRYRDIGPLEPKFEEFVRYLIDTDLLNYSDDHWIPYNAYCTPCLVRYDFVAKVETLTEDQLFFIHSLNLPSWVTPTRRHSSPKKSSNISKDYYSQITKTQINKLYEKFKLDFEMFNYSVNPYLQYARE